ncbi:MAG TPA: hypothetical protein VGM91_19010 [Conexibacter sp.]|jgi:hypothetical protein
MTEPIIPIIPHNPDIFPVPAVRMPRIDPREHDERRREQEDDERGREQAHQRERARAQRARRTVPPPPDDGRPHIDTTA